jgi:NADH:ubiquinone reductase (H+-translocating)
MKRIVVLGGGFGGLTAAESLDRLFQGDDDVDITLISDTNFMVYTPMLADVAGGTIEPRYAVPPLRAFLRRRARFQEGNVDGIDVAEQRVRVTYAKGAWDQWSGSVAYDYLVIALGAVTNFSHIPGATEYALGLKDLPDAIFLRNRVLTMLERADTITDAKRRREMLTFVVAGGGYSGVEGVAALEDLAFGALRYYPNVHPGELRFILAPHGTRLLDQIAPELGDYVALKFRQRTIDVRLGIGVTSVAEASVTLSNGEVIPTRTVVCTAGIEVNPVLQSVDLPKDRHGALQVNGQMQVRGHPNIFALGDCAAVPMVDGGFYAPTAQNAIREAPVAAANVGTLLRGLETSGLKTFDYKSIGSLASLGQRQAVAQIGPLRLSGLPAWFAWRGIYLAKLPTMADKILVFLAWITDLFAPVDIVQLQIDRNIRILKEKQPPIVSGASQTGASTAQPVPSA